MADAIGSEAAHDHPLHLGDRRRPHKARRQLLSEREVCRRTGFLCARADGIKVEPREHRAVFDRRLPAYRIGPSIAAVGGSGQFGLEIVQQPFRRKKARDEVAADIRDGIGHAFMESFPRLHVVERTGIEGEVAATVERIPVRRTSIQGQSRHGFSRPAHQRLAILLPRRPNLQGVAADESAAVERKVLERMRRRADELGESVGTGGHVGKRHVAHGLAAFVGRLSDDDSDRERVDAIHDDAVEHDVLDQRLLHAVVRPAATVLVKKPHVDAARRIVDRDVRERAVAHDAVLAPSETDGVGIRPQLAVDDRHALGRLAFTERTAVGPHDDGVVADRHAAVRDRHVARTVDVDAVVVRIVEIGKS